MISISEKWHDDTPSSVIHCVSSQQQQDEDGQSLPLIHVNYLTTATGHHLPIESRDAFKQTALA